MSTMTTTTTTKVEEENPSKTLITTDDQQPPPSDSDSHHHPTEADPETGYSPAIQQPSQPSSAALETSQKDRSDESKAIEGDPVKSDGGGGDSVTTTDTLKKIRRAERFGMPVKLSEEEKRNSRAERFGTGSGLQASDSVKKSEEQKRKARAERFGLAQSVPTADEEVKKKARLARFAPAASAIDSQEEDKKKARALRSVHFDISMPFPPHFHPRFSQANGKGNIEPKPAIAGKAGGGD
ncbi:hypothetical protein LguiA_032243 [Lonicera macranthoides]